MAINIPGLSLSILRQQTTVRAGLPLLISGRFTAFGMGVPSFIRVFLEGPSYDPQIRSFDTFSSPFSGVEMTEKAIKNAYKRLHDDLSEIYYDGNMGITKEDFDLQHGQIWSNMEAELIDKGYLTLPEPPRDLIAEFDELKIKVGKLENRGIS